MLVETFEVVQLRALGFDGGALLFDGLVDEARETRQRLFQRLAQRCADGRSQRRLGALNLLAQLSLEIFDGRSGSRVDVSLESAKRLHERQKAAHQTSSQASDSGHQQRADAGAERRSSE